MLYEVITDIRYVLGYNLQAYGTSSTLRLKSALNRGGTVEYIYMTDVIADGVQNVLAADLNWNPSYSYSELPAEYKGKEVPEHCRITSYNVCYTKLLRNVSGLWKKHIQ